MSPWLAARHPLLAGVFGTGVLALVGLPPFSLFASELGIARAGFAADMGWPTAAALAMVLVAAGALVVHTSRMLLGDAPPGPDGTTGVAVRTDLSTGVSATVLVGGLAGCGALGVAAGPLTTLFDAAVATLGVR